ncbi:unnamed protein product [Leptidea sinapis]|uniref:USP domain-containing protein n=1 Tax=Leptidea sinapis TaxID=189913 RepID=A0A5E4QHU6_9NEOP|nr:unnamed protein product [Leptidea sinapis]
MPVNYMSETKKGVDRTKFSLSLNKNNVAHLNRESKPGFFNETPTKKTISHNKENKPVKRPLQGTYTNTLNAAKKLKPLGETTKQPGSTLRQQLIVLEIKGVNSAMLNGHHPSDNQYGGSSQSKTPIATLANLGNTCFLNSVLYTLRYAPQFVHNLHHLVSDLSRVEQKLGSIRLKSSSLGRSAAGIASSGTRSWSSKDLLSLGQSDYNTAKSKIQETIPTTMYILWAVIMHLGQTLTGGHYVAYVRDTQDLKCDRESTTDLTSNSSSSFMRTLFNRPRPQPTGCTAKECCVPRQRPESGWLACDDDLVKPISNEEFEDLLSAEPKMRSAATPYLLFYVKSEVN